MKKTWMTLNNALGKNKNRSEFPNVFSIDDTLVSDKATIAAKFNDYFAQIGLTTGQQVPPAPYSFTDYLPAPSPHSMFMDPVMEPTVLNTAFGLKTKTSSGHDGISTKLLKATILYVISPVTYIINQSLLTGIIPDELKIAKVIPIYKAADKSSLCNYRPISLLPAFSKLFEKVMFNKIVVFLEKHDILYKHQYGFRSKHSTIHPIIHFINHCAEANNSQEPQSTLAVFCDLSKAFDVINHDILLHKLRVLGFRGVVNDWLRNYLSNRKQYVQFESYNSSLVNISCGVPQGSILGPLLYLLYVNDIASACSSKILSFADDTTMFLSNRDLDTMYQKANVDINKLYYWFCANKLSLNANKTKYIVVSPVNRRVNLDNRILKIANTELSRIGNDCEETFTKFLGLYIDDTLSWKHHIKFINNKITRAIFAISQVKHLLPKESLRILYFALVHPHITYGILAWGNSGSALNKTMILQKRAIRIIHNAPFNFHTEPLFKASGILKIFDLYEYETLIFMYKYWHNKLPLSFNELFICNKDIQHKRTTRQSNLLYNERCFTNFSSKCPIFNFPRIWNSWYDIVGSARTRGSLVKVYKERVLDSYSAYIKCKNVLCRQCFT